MTPSFAPDNLRRIHLWAFAAFLMSAGLLLHTMRAGLILPVLCVAIFILQTLPGHCAVYSVFYGKGRLLDGLIWGSIAGTGLSSLMISVIVYNMGWNFPVVAGTVVIIPLFILGSLVWKKGIGKTYETADPLHGTALHIILLLCLLFFYLPYKNMGAEVDQKHVYTWLFGHDFINRQVHVLSASRGLPLESYHFAGEKLSYYWLAYIYPALLYNVFSAKLSIQNIMQLSSVIYSALTASALYLFFTHFIKDLKVLLVLLVLTFAAYSYMYLYYVAGLFFSSAPVMALLPQGNLVSDGFAGFSHSLYRFFLVEPQGVLGIGTMLLIILLYNVTPKSIYTRLLLGLFLGLLFGIEATMGIILAFWFVAVALRELWLNRSDVKELIRGHIVSAAAAGLIYLCLFGIEMYSFRTGNGVLQLKPNIFPIVTAPLYFPLEYGPALFFGIAGMIKSFRARDGNGYPVQFIILLGLSLFFVFFIVSPTESQFGLLKATRIIPVCLLILTAYLWNRGMPRAGSMKLVAALVIAAVPTYFTDMHIASNIKNTGSTYIREADLKACSWIKTNLPPGSVVQAEPNYPGTDPYYSPLYYYSLIPIFAERPTGIGEWKVSGQEHSSADSLRERFHSIRKIFSTDRLDECIGILTKYNIGYVYVGELEKKLNPAGVKKFLNREYFDEVYSGNAVSLFKLKQERVPKPTERASTE